MFASLWKRTRKLISYLPRFSVASLLWLSVVVAILTLWFMDHQRLQRMLDIRSGLNSNHWSIDQLRGPPDTKGFGDLPTAWASQLSDGNVEWVIVEFQWAVAPQALQIVETYNPGAVVEVRSVDSSGGEAVLWAGKDPLLGTTTGRGTSTIPISSSEKLRRFKIVLDSMLVPGWNEIDAVGLKDTSGSVQWVSAAWASSSYGKNRPPPSWYWP